MHVTFSACWFAAFFTLYKKENLHFSLPFPSANQLQKLFDQYLAFHATKLSKKTIRGKEIIILYRVNANSDV